MKIVFVAAAASLLWAGAASAQTPIRVGQSVSGELSSSDAALSDGSFFDCYALSTRDDRRYRIDLSSEDVDAYLAVLADSCQGEAIDTDDDSGGGTDARLEIAGTVRTLYIRANSLSEGETGAYRLSVSEVAAAGSAASGPAATTRIIWGGTVQGSLSADDVLAEDESYYDCLVFDGRRGQRAVVTMRSRAFDTFVSLYQGGRCEGEALESNDDGEDGTNSRLEFVLPANGAYAIRANSLSAGETGDYTLILSDGNVR